MKRNYKNITIPGIVHPRRSKTGRLISRIQVRKHRSSSGTGEDLSVSFLEEATIKIIQASRDKMVPVIYAENGIIYKDHNSQKRKLGEITPIARKTNHTHYSIEFIRP